MLWERKSVVKTYRIDVADWAQFVEAIGRSDKKFLDPSQIVRELILLFTAKFPPAPPEPPPATNGKTKAPKTRPGKLPIKKAKSNRAK